MKGNLSLFQGSGNVHLLDPPDEQGGRAYGGSDVITILFASISVPSASLIPVDGVVCAALIDASTEPQQLLGHIRKQHGHRGNVVRDEEEAIRMANDTRYGLAANVWTRKKSKGLEIARRIHAGSVCVNDMAKRAGLGGQPASSSFSAIH